MSRLRDCFGREFLITSEITLPRGPDLTKLNSEITEYKKLGGKIHAVNVVDNPGSTLLMGSLAASILLKQNGLEPVYQVTGRDRNQLGIQADLIGAAAFGIENVLALTGDPPTSPSSDHPKAKPVFDLNSVSIAKTMKSLNSGTDINGRKINKPTNFFIGAALAPASGEGEIKKTKLKIEAGVEFFQTQVIFEPQTLKDFINKYREKYGENISEKILVGVLPPHSTQLISFLKKIPGINIPKKVEERINKAEDPLREGVSIAVEVINEVRDLGIAGAHIMPAGKTEALKALLKEIKTKK